MTKFPAWVSHERMVARVPRPVPRLAGRGVWVGLAMNFPILPWTLPLRDDRYHEPLINKAREVRESCRPKNGWIAEGEAHVTRGRIRNDTRL